MNHKIKNAFESIQAEEALKQRTKVMLAQKTNHYGRQKFAHFRPVLTAAACLFLVFGGYRFYFTPTAEISIDINPSIELAVNRFDRVISVSSYNEDGAVLADTLDVKFENYDEAVEQILENESINALLSNNEILTITVVASEKTGEAQHDRILAQVEEHAAAHQNTYCYSAHSQEVAAAHDAGLSCGKYLAFLELQSLEPDVTTEDVQDMTMREIHDCIHSHSGDGSDNSTTEEPVGSKHEQNKNEHHNIQNEPKHHGGRR